MFDRVVIYFCLTDWLLNATQAVEQLRYEGLNVIFGRLNGFIVFRPYWMRTMEDFEKLKSHQVSTRSRKRIILINWVYSILRPYFCTYPAKRVIKSPQWITFPKQLGQFLSEAGNLTLWLNVKFLIDFFELFLAVKSCSQSLSITLHSLLKLTRATR